MNVKNKTSAQYSETAQKPREKRKILKVAKTRDILKQMKKDKNQRHQPIKNHAIRRQ